MKDIVWNEGEQLIFVGGSPRSGTTLVQNILDSHPDIAGGPEFDLVKYFIEFRNRIQLVFKKSEQSININVICSNEDLDNEIGFVIERILLQYGQKKGKKLVSEKTPDNILYFESLLEIFPKSRFIFCIRDPRSVISSLLEVGKRAKQKGIQTPYFTTNIFEAINMVNEHNLAGFKLLDNPKVVMIRYEDLVENPEKETRRICKWLNLDWSENLLRQDEIKHDGEVGLTEKLTGIWYDRDRYYQKITTKNINSWEKRLTILNKSILYLSYHNDILLKSIGYSFSNKGIPKPILWISSIYLTLRNSSKRIIKNIINYIIAKLKGNIKIRMFASKFKKFIIS